MRAWGEALPREMARVRDKVMPAYLAIGPAGGFALAMREHLERGREPESGNLVSADYLARALDELDHQSARIAELEAERDAANVLIHHTQEAVAFQQCRAERAKARVAEVERMLAEAKALVENLVQHKNEPIGFGQIAWNNRDFIIRSLAAYDEAIAALAGYHERDGWRCSCLHPTKHDSRLCTCHNTLNGWYSPR